MSRARNKRRFQTCTTGCYGEIVSPSCLYFRSRLFAQLRSRPISSLCPQENEYRAQLSGYYAAGESGTDRELASGAHPSRLRHLYWVIEHHPESELATIANRLPGLSANPGRQNQKDLWRRQADRFPRDARVFKNEALAYMK